ncbi:hypothetical protein [Streptomyces sp. RK62]|uniref:hypothetical protein n=1 Tax=Streptomyces sp. RK62 TaxID=2824893 RepID=UPI001B395906|nr:hypothetical protein [Streptomyces sp. RK62]MBQ0997446.1 hypothetical protein [Streptomyces sp. RK62]
MGAPLIPPVGIRRVQLHTSQNPQRQTVPGSGEGLPGSARGKCWDRAEALRADLERAVVAYEALRTRAITTSRHVRQHKRANSPPPARRRHPARALDTLDAQTEDPGPLKLARSLRERS